METPSGTHKTPVKKLTCKLRWQYKVVTVTLRIGGRTLDVKASLVTSQV